MQEYVNEPVINEGEDKRNVYGLYSFIIQTEEHARDIETRKEGRLFLNVQKALQEGKAESFSEAVEYVQRNMEGGLYKHYGDSPEETVRTIKDVVETSVDNYLNTREESFRLAFLPYVEGVLLAGLKAGILVNSWWRLVNYGFSVEPYDKDGKEVAFPYSSVSAMKKKDGEAFRLLVLDYYAELETTGSVYHAREAWREEDENGKLDLSFRPYPKDGFTAEEIASQHSYKGEEPIKPEELYESWEWDIELYLPFLVYRFEESLYFALKYPGNEYKRHIESLNVREDWDNNYGETEYSYGKIFGEEA